jgi:hypothetical protein
VCVIPALKPLVTIIAVVVASAGAHSARAADPVRPDPNPAGVVPGVAPDPASGSVRARPRATTVVTQRREARAVATSAARTWRPSSEPRPALARRVAPVRPRRQPVAERRAAGAAFATLLQHWRTSSWAARPQAGGELASSSEPWNAQLVAALVLAAAVLASGSLLTLIGRQSRRAEA